MSSVMFSCKLWPQRGSVLRSWKGLQTLDGILGRYCNAGIHSISRKIAPLQERRMVDRFRLCVKGGDGGDGCTSFRKSRHARHGYADGGNGGKGGDVILVSSDELWDFSNLQHHMKGGDGGAGTSKARVGSRGSHKIVRVPVGTVVHISKGYIPSNKVSSLKPKLPWQMATEDAPESERFNFEACQRIHSSNDHASDGEDSCDYASDEESCEHGKNDANVHFEDRFHGKNLDQRDVVPGWNNVAMQNKDLAVGASFHSVDDGSFISDSDIDSISFLPSSRHITQSNVAELLEPEQNLVVAIGGMGGRGNASAARGHGKHKALPSFEHEPGKLGSEAVLILELKSIADIGLVGAPNAGKSTLLGAISRAKPSVGHYAFTTLRPNIGRVEYADYFSLTVADVPGLIEGAHMNKGLGFAFLRHIERTKALAYVLDLSSALDDRNGFQPWEQLKNLKYELEAYQSGLSSRPSLVIATKTDEEGTGTILHELRQRIPAMPIYPVCAVLGEGINELLFGFRNLLNDPLVETQCYLSRIRA